MSMQLPPFFFLFFLEDKQSSAKITIQCFRKTLLKYLLNENLPSIFLAALQRSLKITI